MVWLAMLLYPDHNMAIFFLPPLASLAEAARMVTCCLISSASITWLEKTAVWRWEQIKQSWSTYIYTYILYNHICNICIYIYTYHISIYSTVIYLLSLSLNRSGFIVGQQQMLPYSKAAACFRKSYGPSDHNLPGIFQLGSSYRGSTTNQLPSGND